MMEAVAFVAFLVLLGAIYEYSSFLTYLPVCICRQTHKVRCSDRS